MSVLPPTQRQIYSSQTGEIIGAYQQKKRSAFVPFVPCFGGSFLKIFIMILLGLTELLDKSSSYNICLLQTIAVITCQYTGRDIKKNRPEAAAMLRKKI